MTDPIGVPPPQPPGDTDEVAVGPERSSLFDVEPQDLSGPLTPSGNLRRRQMISRFAAAVQTTSALLAVAVLGIVIYSVASRGASVLSFGFLTKDPPEFVGLPGGGIAPAIAGTAVIIAIATAIAMPVGILTALYLTEFAGRWEARALRLALDLLNGLPSIVVGLFVFGLLVVGHHQSGFAGAFALAIIMLPLIARASQEVLLLVPAALREAADALGVSRWRAVLGVVLPTARGGILTATVLAVARAAGETAPLILASSIYSNTVSVNPFGHEGLANIPVYIFTASEEADRYGFARAWGAAFILLMFILLVSLGSRAIDRRTTLSR
jgi:phosphate transport system permease protein